MVLYNDEEATIVVALLLIKYVILRQTISRTGLDKEPETLLTQGTKVIHFSTIIEMDMSRDYTSYIITLGLPHLPVYIT